MLEDDDDDEPEVPLPNLDPETLRRVIAFCTYHNENPLKEIPKPLMSSNLRDYVDAFDVDLLERENEHGHKAVFKLMMAANYLNIPSLLDLTCAKIAALMRGKTDSEVGGSTHMGERLIEIKR